MLPLLEEAYINTGKLQLVYKEYPVVGGEAAFVAGLAGQCAGVQGDFWSMHNWIFDNMDSWRSGDPVAAMVAAADELGLDGAALQICIDEQATRELIAEDYRDGQTYGIRGTPNFVVNGHLIQGLMQPQQFAAIIDALIIQAESGELPDTVATVTPSPTPDTDFADESVATKGDADAPIVIVEFSDYQCPFCQRYFEQTYPALMSEYVDTGKVRYVFKDFPLTNLHPQAVGASVAAECAGQQDAYWQMHDKLFSEQNRWSGQSDDIEAYLAFAGELELDVEAFAACQEDEAVLADVSEDFQEGVAAGVTGTPAFFINGTFISGAQPYEVFQQIIEQALAQ
ncbi:MAG: thioredoxin domain-containing protein [Chloroflexi bacterium]|nr:thioredoxin domain-containing protein [Chloroflexota bacterium]